MPAVVRVWWRCRVPTGSRTRAAAAMSNVWMPLFVPPDRKATADQHDWCCKSRQPTPGGTNMCMSAHKPESTPMWSMQLNASVHRSITSYLLLCCVFVNWIILWLERLGSLVVRLEKKNEINPCNEDALVSYAWQISADAHIQPRLSLFLPAGEGRSFVLIKLARSVVFSEPILVFVFPKALLSFWFTTKLWTVPPPRSPTRKFPDIVGQECLCQGAFNHNIPPFHIYSFTFKTERQSLFFFSSFFFLLSYINII